MKPRLFFIQDAPAVGKTAIMDRLRSNYPKGVFLEMDTIRKLRGKVDWNAHGEEYQLALETIAGLIEFHSAKNGADPIFVIDCLSEKGLSALEGYLKKPLEYKQIIVWAEDAEIERRMKSRKDHPFGNIEIALKMNSWLKEYSKEADQKKVFFLDTTGMTIDKSAKKMKSIIDKAHG